MSQQVFDPNSKPVDPKGGNGKPDAQRQPQYHTNQTRLEMQQQIYSSLIFVAVFLVVSPIVYNSVSRYGMLENPVAVISMIVTVLSLVIGFGGNAVRLYAQMKRLPKFVTDEQIINASLGIPKATELLAVRCESCMGTIPEGEGTCPYCGSPREKKSMY